MATTLEEVRQATQARHEAKEEARMERNQCEPKRWNYTYLKKSDKNIIDGVDCGDMLKMLDNDLYEVFAWVLGILVDMKMKGAQLSEDQEKVLKFPLYLYKATQK